MDMTTKTQLETCIATLQAQINDCLRLSYKVRSSINKYTLEYREDQTAKIEKRMRALEAGILSLQEATKPKESLPIPKGATHQGTDTGEYYKVSEGLLCVWVPSANIWAITKDCTEQLLDSSAGFKRVYF